MRVVDDIKPTLSGADNVPVIKPTISFIGNAKPTLSLVQRTNVQVYDQRLTYNEAGITYNEGTVAYGGIFSHDIMPITSRALAQSPRIVFAGDIAGSVTPPPSGGATLMGVLGLTYP